MRALESSIVAAVGDFGIDAVGRSAQVGDDGEALDATGVWVGSKKLASIGIGVRHWISFHGFALNVDHDTDAFVGMKPCGFASSTMTSMEEILGTRVDREALKTRLQVHLSAKLKPYRSA
jgi:lipoate-protein ligase B